MITENRLKMEVPKGLLPKTYRNSYSDTVCYLDESIKSAILTYVRYGGKCSTEGFCPFDVIVCGGMFKVYMN